MREGWQIRKLSEVCDLQNGFAFKSKTYVDHSNTLNIRMSNIRPNGNFDPEHNIKYLPDSYADEYKQFLLNDGDLVIAMTDMAGEPKILGLPTIVKNHKSRAFLLNQRVGKLKDFSDDIHIPYLRYYLSSPKIKEYYKSKGAGGLQINISKKDILTAEIPVPSLNEQKRIVAILDEAFAGIDTAIANTEKNLANARELFESYLNSVFTKQSEGWSLYKLVNLTTKIGSGATPKGGEKSYKTEGISLFRSLNVYDRRFTNRKLAFIDDEQAAKLSNVVVEEGDVLFNITGASVARCCVAPKEYLPARVNQHVSILRPKSEELDTDFLCYLMTSRIYKDQLLGIGDEGGSTRQAITKSQLQDLKITIPDDLTEQKNVVQQLNSLESETLRLESLYKQKHDSLTELKQSLLQKAFSGELTAEGDKLMDEAVA